MYLRVSVGEMKKLAKIEEDARGRLTCVGRSEEGEALFKKISSLLQPELETAIKEFEASFSNMSLEDELEFLVQDAAQFALLKIVTQLNHARQLQDVEIDWDSVDAALEHWNSVDAALDHE
jgi:hypothetical protein